LEKVKRDFFLKASKWRKTGTGETIGIKNRERVDSSSWKRGKKMYVARFLETTGGLVQYLPRSVDARRKGEIEGRGKELLKIFGTFGSTHRTN